MKFFDTNIAEPPRNPELLPWETLEGAETPKYKEPALADRKYDPEDIKRRIEEWKMENKRRQVQVTTQGALI